LDQKVESLKRHHKKPSLVILHLVRRAGGYFETSNFEDPGDFFEIVIPGPWSSFSVASYNLLTRNFTTTT